MNNFIGKSERENQVWQYSMVVTFLETNSQISGMVIFLGDSGWVVIQLGLDDHSLKSGNDKQTFPSTQENDQGKCSHIHNQTFPGFLSKSTARKSLLLKNYRPSELSSKKSLLFSKSIIKKFIVEKFFLLSRIDVECRWLRKFIDLFSLQKHNQQFSVL